MGKKRFSLGSLSKSLKEIIDEDDKLEITILRKSPRERRKTIKLSPANFRNKRPTTKNRRRQLVTTGKNTRFKDAKVTIYGDELAEVFDSLKITKKV